MSTAGDDWKGVDDNSSSKAEGKWLEDTDSRGRSGAIRIKKWFVIPWRLFPFPCDQSLAFMAEEVSSETDRYPRRDLSSSVRKASLPR